MIHIDITIRDEEWPLVKWQINTPDRQSVSGSSHYSIAASQSEPAIRDTVKKAMEAMIETKRKRRE